MTNPTLEKVINHYTFQGYRVVSQTDNAAQLVKPKQFSWIFGVILFFLFFIPFFLYLLYYLMSKDESLYIVVSEDGSITITDGHGRIKKYADADSPASVPISGEQAANNTQTGLFILIALMIIGVLVTFIVNYSH